MRATATITSGNVAEPVNGRVDAGPTAVGADGNVTLVPLTLMLVDDVAWCPVTGTVDVVVVDIGADVLDGTPGVTVGGDVVVAFAAVVDVAALVDVVAPVVDGATLVVATVPAVVEVAAVVDVVVLGVVVSGNQIVVVVVLHGVVELDGGDPLHPAQCGFATLPATPYPLSCWSQFEFCGWGPEVEAPAFGTTSVAKAKTSTARPATVATIPTDRAAPPSCV